MAAAMKGICILLVMSVLVAMAPGGEAQLQCGTVISYLHPCIPYVSRPQGPLGSCCSGVRGLYSTARTTRDRQSVCNCLKGVAKNHPEYDVSKAAALPGLCGVNVASKISLSTDCTKVS
ncbi:non-specific lipid-transfer protein 1-like [Primulina eburnea]|uniref:non-specific lipid-transfer protein 1-like n=1 Tax=Primulina eburnea TaxID=1245227 RepID=UPI003C6C53D8